MGFLLWVTGVVFNYNTETRSVNSLSHANGDPFRTPRPEIRK